MLRYTARECLISIFVLLVVTLLAQAPAEAAPMLGSNAMNLEMYYHGKGASMSGSDAEVWVGTMLARKAMADAQDMNFSFVRVAFGYGPQYTSGIGVNNRNDDISQFFVDSANYWTEVDHFLDDLDAANLKVVPVLMFNDIQYPVISGETVSQMIKGSSESRVAAKVFIQAFLKRYAKRKTILFVELSNEYNLGADIPAHDWCMESTDPRWNTAVCAAVDEYSTADLVGFTTDMIKFIRATAPNVLVSTGFTLPRPNATALVSYPFWTPNALSWVNDTKSQMLAMINLLNCDADIVSIHVYPGDGRYGETEAQTLADVTDYVHNVMGKKLYVGEWGDVSVSSYMTSMLTQFQSSAVDFASVWTWEFNQALPWVSASGYNLDPETTPAINQVLAAAMGGGPVASNQPRTVLVSPLPCMQIQDGASVTLGAVASGADSVEFYIDGQSVGSVSSPPFQFQASMMPGLHTVTAVGVSKTSNTASSYQVVVGSNIITCSLPELSTFAPQASSGLAVAAAMTMQAPSNALGLQSTAIALGQRPGPQRSTQTQFAKRGISEGPGSLPGTVNPVTGQRLLASGVKSTPNPRTYSGFAIAARHRTGACGGADQVSGLYSVRCWASTSDRTAASAQADSLTAGLLSNDPAPFGK